MATKKDLSSPREGMNRDIHESELSNSQYAFALNANYQDEHGNGAVMLQNEPSNLLCSTFKPGFKVIGFRYDVNSDNTYFFLVNPTTDVSEIGYIKHRYSPTSLEALENDCECNVSAILEQPLETVVQTPLCVYYTLLSDPTCPGKIGFNINYPIYENNIQIKNERLGKSIYFTDGLNPPRYINLSEDGTVAHQKYMGNFDCHTGIYEPYSCINVDEMRIFPLYNKPCASSIDIMTGSDLRAGTYQTLMAYCNSNGDELSQYFLLSLPINIYDRNNNILDRSNLDYVTNQGYTISLSNLDKTYEFFKVVVIYVSGLHGDTSYYNYNVYTTDTKSFSVTTVSNKVSTNLKNLLITKPNILTTQGMTNSNGYLIQNGVKQRRTINLQPVVNLMGAFAKWTTQQAKENLYERGDSSAKFKGYMRDEVYPFAIKFIMTGGYETDLFPLVPRPAFDGADGTINEIDLALDDINTQSVLEYNTECSINNRQYRWQFENTADPNKIKDLECNTPGVDVTLKNKPVTDSCDIPSKYGVNDLGDWNATTNTPTLVVGTGIEGDFYIVNTAGTQTFGAGPISFNIGDLVVRHSGDWILEKEKVTAEITGPTTLTYVSNYDLVTYLNDNIDYYRTYVSDIANENNAVNLLIHDAIVAAETISTNCLPDFIGKALAPPAAVTTTASKASVLSVIVTSDTYVDVAPSSPKYIHVAAPKTCASLLLDVSTNDITEDAVLSKFISPGGVVYQRNPATNITYDAAKTIQYLASPQVDSPKFLPQSIKTVNSDKTKLYTKVVATPVTVEFESFVHKNAIWFVVDLSEGVAEKVEISKTWCNFSDDNTENEIRISFYDDPSTFTTPPVNTVHIADTTLYNPSIPADLAKHYFTLDPIDYPSGSAYIAIDSPLKLSGASSSQSYIIGDVGDMGYISITRTVPSLAIGVYQYEIPDDGVTKAIDNFIEKEQAKILAEVGVVVEKTGNNGMTFYHATTTTVACTVGLCIVFPPVAYYTLKPPCGCFNIFRHRPLKEHFLTFSNLTFGTAKTYDTVRSFSTPILGNCDVAPHKRGYFAYWESTEQYPCNAELYDSSALEIHRDTIRNLNNEDFKDFNDYFYEGLDPGSGNIYNFLASKPYYTNLNLSEQPIKHYKFPDNKVVPFMSTKDNAPGDFKDDVIYPIGFEINPTVINTFLDVALANGLIDTEERSLITQYEIYRGDRAASRSVVAKGLLFDVLKESEKGSYYSNYPLNTLGNDRRNESFDANWFGSRGNINYTFYSPDTSFANPTLPRELSIEGTMYGKSKMYYDTVDRHSTYILLGEGAYSLASALAGLEYTFEMLGRIGDWMIQAFSGGPYTATVASVAAIVQLGLTAAAQFFQIGTKRLQWITTLYDLGHPVNHAYYQVATGHYNVFDPTPVTSNSRLRGLTISHYLKEGLWNLADEFNDESLKINNRDRENQVFLSLSNEQYKLDYSSKYFNYDNETSNPTKSSRQGYSGKGLSPEIVGNTAALYGTLKQYNPAQHGVVNSILWHNTGFCGNLDADPEDCTTIFGGDIFISRFAVKRKFPFFTTTAFGLAPLTPFVYSYYFNINPDSDIATGRRSYLNYKMIDEDTYSEGLVGLFFPSQRSQFRLENTKTKSSKLYINPEAKFFLYSYGFPYFLVESEYNCNYRYAGINMDENFYPNTGDLIAFTQERYVPIRSQETFNYNPVYSYTPMEKLLSVLPENYKREDYDKVASMPNSIIVSRKDNSEATSVYIDPWLVYTSMDEKGHTSSNYSTFPTNFGELKSVKAIESAVVLVRFTNTVTTFTTTEGTIFDELAATQTKSFNKTDLGYAGTQHQAMLSTEFGHVWVDAQRGKVFTIKTGAGGIEEISKGMEKWFKENLPMILPKYFNINPDNAYNGVGISMGWDDRLKRIFITKKDFRPKSNLPVTLLYTESVGFHYMLLGAPQIVQLGDPIYFEDCSWTVAFNHVADAWISYYSFKPNYYISQNDYFQTGINYSMDPTEVGLWSHYSFLTSYQVYYGKLYPFTVEYAVPTKYSDSLFETVAYMLDVRKYYNRYDFANIYGIGFNKAVVYNNQQNTGLLELHHQKENDISQAIDYPKFNANSISILQSCINNKWSFNYLYNLVKNDKSGLPLWLYDAAKVDKNINHKLLDYQSNYKDRLRGNYFKVQLTNDLESRYKFILQYAIDDRNFYDQ